LNIYINARFLTQSVTGVQRVSCEIVKAIDDLLDKAETDLNNYKVILLSPKNIIYTLPLKHIELKSVGMLKGISGNSLSCRCTHGRDCCFL